MQKSTWHYTRLRKPGFLIHTNPRGVHTAGMNYGRTRNGVKRYCCKSCNRTFTIITGTIFKDHRIPIPEWIDFCLCLFRFQSFTSISKTNRNAYSTVKYWLMNCYSKVRHTMQNF